MRRQRFRMEQLTVAQLNHPGIARIYDSNMLADGTPWFVMEYAHGLPLTEHWSRYATTFRDWLQLIRRACEVMQYAHSRAIIHRNLKPSNILVAESGAVKLLDFGVAKQLNSEESLQSRTVTGLQMMTLAYAAPEQLAGKAVGVYTDVYALGVLLYELLTDRLPQRDNQLGILAFQRKQLDAAQYYFTQARDTWKQLFGDQYPSVAAAHSNLGSVCLEQKNLNCAEAMYRDAVSRLDISSANSLNDAGAHLKLERALLREGRFAEAEPESFLDTTA